MWEKKIVGKKIQPASHSLLDVGTGHLTGGSVPIVNRLPIIIMEFSIFRGYKLGYTESSLALEVTL